MSPLALVIGREASESLSALQQTIGSLGVFAAAKKIDFAQLFAVISGKAEASDRLLHDARLLSQFVHRWPPLYHSLLRTILELGKSKGLTEEGLAKVVERAYSFLQLGEVPAGSALEQVAALTERSLDRILEADVPMAERPCRCPKCNYLFLT